MTQKEDFMDQWSAEDYEIYGQWMRTAEKLRPSQNIVDIRQYSAMLERLTLVWEKEILPTNIEEHLAVKS
jgi:hypothetical protein